MACVLELFVNWRQVMINDAKMDLDAHAGSREEIPAPRTKVEGGDFNHGVMKATKTSRHKGLYHVTQIYELPVMLILLMHPCLIRGSRVY